MNKKTSLIYIKRKSYLEDSWLKEMLANLDPRWELIVVGHTYEKTDDFIYIPFWENGLDERGLICHKKNLGVKAVTTELCLVVHADVKPALSFIDNLEKILVLDNEHIAPVGFCDGNRTLTWCQNREPRSQPPSRCDDAEMYISGAAILGTKKTFLETPWNEDLSHGRCEDVELSCRARAKGVTLRCEPTLIVNMKRSQ